MAVKLPISIKSIQANNKMVVVTTILLYNGSIKYGL